MKKIVALMLILTLTACLAFSACGNSADSGGPVAEPVSESAGDTGVDSGESSSEEDPTSERSEEAEPEDSSDIEDLSAYAAEMQEMVDALSGLYGDSIKIGISTEGDNTLIVTYTLLDDSLGLTADIIEENMVSQGQTMEQLASQMAEGGISAPSIIVKWIGEDGSELFNQKYT